MSQISFIRNYNTFFFKNTSQITQKGADRALSCTFLMQASFYLENYCGYLNGPIL